MRTSSLFLLLGNLVGISLQLKRQALQEDPVPVRFVEQVLSSTDPKDYCNVTIFIYNCIALY